MGFWGWCDVISYNIVGIQIIIMMNSLAGLKTVKKKYFTQSQSVLPISHSKEEFVSIIEKKREYQTLIKKEL